MGSFRCNHAVLVGLFLPQLFCGSPTYLPSLLPGGFSPTKDFGFGDADARTTGATGIAQDAVATASNATGHLPTATTALPAVFQLPTACLPSTYTAPMPNLPCVPHVDNLRIVARTLYNDARYYAARTTPGLDCSTGGKRTNHAADIARRRQALNVATSYVVTTDAHTTATARIMRMVATWPSRPPPLPVCPPAPPPPNLRHLLVWWFVSGPASHSNKPWTRWYAVWRTGGTTRRCAVPTTPRTHVRGPF